MLERDFCTQFLIFIICEYQFTFIFKRVCTQILLNENYFYFQPNYVLQRSQGGQSVYTFSKIIDKMTNNNKINDSYKESGQILMAPITANFNKTGKKRSRKVSLMGQFANRVQVTAQTKLNQIAKSKLVQ